MRANLFLDRRKRKKNIIPPLRQEEQKQRPPSRVFITKEEEKVYGDRCPTGYRKLQLLGKGGCAIVWLAEQLQTGIKVAIKQVSKVNSQSATGAIEACRREIHIGKHLMKTKHPANSLIAKLLEVKTDNRDIWVVYELGGISMAKALFKMRGEFVKGERMYKIEHQLLYSAIASNREIFKEIIRELLNVLDLLSELGIVHSDLKPDNILIQMRDSQFVGIKLIDFGSSFMFAGTGAVQTATPEYMPPESLQISKMPGNSLQLLQKISHPWSFDIWSLGIILLEIISGVPLWMSLKTRVNRMGRIVTTKGLLGVTGRDSNMILRLQHGLICGIRENILKCAAIPVEVELVDLIQQMMQWEPMMRISPSEALEHPYLNGYMICSNF